MTEQESEIRKSVFRWLNNKNEVKDWVDGFLELELPDCIVDRTAAGSNCTPLDMVWECYNQLINFDPSGMRRLYYANRDGGKSLTQSVIEVLTLLHFGGKVIHLAALKEQSENVQRYLKDFFEKPYLKGLVEGDSSTKTKIVYYRPFENDDYLYLYNNEYKSLPDNEKKKWYKDGGSAEVIVCSVRSCNGKHGFLFIDELDVVSDPRALKEAKNIPSFRMRNGKKIMPITVLTSTRKTSFGYVQDEIDSADKTGLVVKHWNVLDVMEACPAFRHRPDLPKLKVYRSDDTLQTCLPETYNNMTEKEKESYVEDEAYHGCVHNCKMFAFCRGQSPIYQKSTSSFLKPVDMVEQIFKSNDLDTAKAQILCRKPSSEGLVYSRFDMFKHVLTPVQAFKLLFHEEPPTEKLTKAEFILMVNRDLEEHTWCGGMDFGYSHNFAYSHGFKFGRMLFITHALIVPELDPDQQVAIMQPFKAFKPIIFPDTARPDLIATFKKHGFNMRAKWNKGTVDDGITIVKTKLHPLIGTPELYFIRDIDPDPYMDLALKYFREYHWKVDAAGNPTGVPDETNDDWSDSTRYLVSGMFRQGKGGLVMAHSTGIAASLQALEQVNKQTSWVSKEIVKLTGSPIPEQKERKMIISKPFSYYGNEAIQFEEVKPIAEEVPKKGRRGRLLFDF